MEVKREAGRKVDDARSESPVAKSVEAVAELWNTESAYAKNTRIRENNTG